MGRGDWLYPPLTLLVLQKKVGWENDYPHRFTPKITKTYLLINPFEIAAIAAAVRFLTFSFL